MLGALLFTPLFGCRESPEALSNLDVHIGNLVVERRSAEGHPERYGDILRDLVRLKCAVIVTTGNAMAQEANRVTTTVPIVMSTSGDPVQAGIVARLARPGGNITGLTLDAGAELEAKRLELLKEVVPRIRRVAYLGSTSIWESPLGQSVRAAAPWLGVTLVTLSRHPMTTRRPFPSSRANDWTASLGNDAHHWTQRQRIVEFARQSRLPALGYSREFAEDGVDMIGYSGARRATWTGS